MPRTITMTVWNAFVTDARVTKEAETLISSGYSVCVIAIKIGALPEHEVLASGIEVVRVHKRPPWIIDFPLRMLRYTNRRLRRGRYAAIREEESPKSIQDAGFVKSRPSGFLRLLSRLGGIAATFRMTWVAWRTKPDVYHAHDANTLFIAWVAAALRRKPLVYDAHEISTDREGYGFISKLVWILERMLTHRVSGMITTTDMRADHFVAAYGCVRPLVLQNRPRLSQQASRPVLRERLGIADERPVVLYQGGLQSGRGLRNLVAVAARIEEADFVFIGGGRQSEELMALARSLDIADRVHFTGAIPLQELPAYTAGATLGVQTLRNTCLNHYTTDSNKLFEYILAGVPVVASDFPEIRKIVNGYGVGKLVDPDDIDGIAGVIRKLLVDEGELGRLRRNCLSAADAVCWEAQEHQLLELYQKILPKQEFSTP